MSDLVDATLGFGSGPIGTKQGTEPTEVVNYYRVLNITQDASRMEIRDAYMRLKSAYNNDNQALYSMLDENETKKTLELIDQAYLNLEDEKAREDYNRKLKNSLAAQTRKKQAHGHHQDARYTTSYSSAADAHAAEYHFGQRERGPESSFPSNLIRATAIRTSDPAVQEAMTAILTDADAGDGDLLRKLREACSVSIEELQERTKILSEYIRGIEENRFDRLPPAVYIRGFIRSILKYLAVVNPDRYAKAYADRLELWKTTAKT